MEFNKRQDNLLNRDKRTVYNGNNTSDKQNSNKIIYKAMQIYEPWMEPGYHEEKEKKSAPETVQEPEPFAEPEVRERSVSVGLSGARTTSRTLLTPVEHVPYEDSTVFVRWVMNGRMDDFGDVKKKLFKNEKDWI